jgi:hypothetical protein
MAKIAVEQTLNSIKTILESNQFEVVDLNLTQQAYVPDVSCYVISGQDKDVMGIADKQADLPVINAHGMTESEVLQQVKQRVQMFESAKR